MADCPSPENPCICECHRWGAECKECRAGRHKPKYPAEKETMTELFLILHKVSGEPAFDIAQRCDDMGTASDPGPWWIIPTSGHRAYPYWSKPLSALTFDLDPAMMAYDGHNWKSIEDCPEMPADWPDHYQTEKRPKPVARDFSLEELGL